MIPFAISSVLGAMASFLMVCNLKAFSNSLNFSDLYVARNDVRIFKAIKIYTFSLRTFLSYLGFAMIYQ